MHSKRVRWLAALLGALAATGVVSCRKRPTPNKGDAPPGALRLSAAGSASNARMWVPPLTALAVGASGIPWATGRIYQPFDFGSGVVSPPETGGIYLTKLDPMSCLATASFTFGAPGAKNLGSSGVAVASSGNVGVIGQFTGEIDFTDRNPEGSGPGGKPGTAGIDFLQSGAATHFFAVLDGGSTGAHATPIKAHMVDLGFGALLSMAANPIQNAFAICGKSDRGVPSWSDTGANKGLITGGKAVAGGDMDIVVAKVDAATGAVLWGKQFGGTGNQVCDSVALDNNGDVIIAGGYAGALSFGTLALPTVANPGLALLYVARLDGTTGAVTAARTWGAVGRSNAYGLAVDSKGNVVVGGVLGGNIDFGGGLSITNYGWTDAFVLKLTPALAPVWAKSFGDDDFDQGVKGLGITSQDNVVIAGTFQGSLGALGLASASRANSDAFTAELAAADAAIISVQAYGDAAGAQGASGVAVAHAAQGGMANATFVGGTFWNTIAFGTTTLNAGGPRSYASFVARLPR